MDDIRDSLDSISFYMLLFKSIRNTKFNYFNRFLRKKSWKTCAVILIKKMPCLLSKALRRSSFTDEPA